MSVEKNSDKLPPLDRQNIINTIAELQAAKAAVQDLIALDDASVNKEQLAIINHQLKVFRKEFIDQGFKKGEERLDLHTTVSESFKITRDDLQKFLAATSPEAQRIVDPPLLAESLTRLFASSKSIDALLGDRQEKFNKDVVQRGEAKAKLFYWLETIRSCGPAAVRLAHLAVKGAAVKYWLGS